MIFQRFEEHGLSHYSYAIGSEKNGQIAIIDPRFDVEVYLQFAEKHQYIISHVLETHIHADYISGAQELTKRARATLISPIADHNKKIANHDRFRLHSIVIEVLLTPGHTPEHICFLVYDTSVSKESPMALFSGDFIFPRSIGTPEVIDKKIWFQLAKELYDSLQKQISPLPNNLKIYPAHGPGFFSGFEVVKGLSTDMEQERMYNPYLKETLKEQAFIDLLYTRWAPLPTYYEHIKIRNACSSAQRVEFPKPYEALGFKNLIDNGGVVIDLRDQNAFSRGHIPKSICIGACDKVGFWASRVIPYDRPTLLVINDPTLLGEIVIALARVGFNQIIGYLSGGWESWKQAELPISKTEEISLKYMQESEHVHVIDVRTLSEWNCGHIPRAKHIPCIELRSRLPELPKDNLVFVCAGGYRSILAASVAEHAGYSKLGHISGGIPFWQRAGGSLITY